MTLSTDWHNIEPMVGRVAVPMMILLRRLWAVMTQSSIRAGQFAITDCVIYGARSLKLIWMTSIETFHFCFVNYFAFGCFLIFLNSFAINNFAFFGFLVIIRGYYMAKFTFTLMSIFFCFTFVKFRNWFDCFAFWTSFRYDFISHFRLLYRRFWLEPNAQPICVSGSFYFIQTQSGCQIKIIDKYRNFLYAYRTRKKRTQ